MGTKLKRRKKTRKDKIKEKPTFSRMPKELRDELNKMKVSAGIVCPIHG